VRTRGFAHSLQGQVGDNRITVSVVNPTEVRTEFGSERGAASKERFDEGEVTEPEAIRLTLRQDDVDTVGELNLYHWDKFTHF
jgi:short-subunit dehydrogenase